MRAVPLNEATDSGIDGMRDEKHGRKNTASRTSVCCQRIAEVYITGTGSANGTVSEQSGQRFRIV